MTGDYRERARDTEIRLTALWGTWAAGRGSGDHESALTAATRYETIADRASDKGCVILGARMLALMTDRRNLGDKPQEGKPPYAGSR